MPLNESIKLGLIGGLLGSVVMDIFMIVVFTIMGEPANIFFSFIGDTIDAFLAIMNISVEGGTISGVVVHYLLGLFLGMIFVAVVIKFRIFQLRSIRKGVFLAIVYTEVVSVFLLLPAVIILEMPSTEAVRLFGMAVIFHLLFGAGLGWFVGYKLRQGTEA